MIASFATETLRKSRAFAASLRDSTSGAALIEFAFSMPIVMALGLFGSEFAYRAIVITQINKVAMHASDHISRIGERTNLSARRVFEEDINDLFVGARLQAGSARGIYDNGRIIISSLEQNATGGQTIKWQRCMGTKPVQSQYGLQGAGRDDNDFPGMGPAGEEVTAPANGAVIFVEVVFDYDPLVETTFIDSQEIRAESAFIVRSDRDLSQLYERSPGAFSATCDQFGTL